MSILGKINDKRELCLVNRVIAKTNHGIQTPFSFRHPIGTAVEAKALVALQLA